MQEDKSETGSHSSNEGDIVPTDQGECSLSLNNAGAAQTGAQVNTKSGIYRKDAAAFYGDDKFEVESLGTQF